LSNWTSAWLQPLITPDRLYRDIQLNGPLHALNTDAFGAARKPRFGSFKQAFQQLQSFTASEITESNLRQPTPQN